MAAPDISNVRKEMHTQNGILEKENLSLATANAFRSKTGLSQMRSTYSNEQHVFGFLNAYSKLDVLAKSIDVSPEVAFHAKLLYSRVYNSCDFEGAMFQHGIVVAGCLYIACCQMNQHRTMTEVFRSSSATAQQVVSVFDALKDFFVVDQETSHLPFDLDRQLINANEDIVKLLNPIRIPFHAASYAKHLYKKTQASDSFKDQDQKTIIASCLFIACRQLEIPRTFWEIFTMLPGASKGDIRKTFESLEAFFGAENGRKGTETSQGIATTADANCHSTEQVVCALQDLMGQLTVEECPVSISPQNAIMQASFAPTAPAPASIADAESNDIDMELSTAPATPFMGSIAHAFHNSAGENNTISILPPTTPATNTSLGNAHAMQKTLYNVICCRCGKILNMQNVHYAFYCLHCHHKRCNNCPTQAI